MTDDIASDEEQETTAPANPVNDEGEELPILDRDRLVAAVDLVRRAGGAGFEVGDSGTDDAPSWWAKATIHNDPRLGQAAGQTARTEDHPSAEDAAEALATFLVEGGVCNHCQRIIALGGDGLERLGKCRWRRQGAKWLRGCE